MTNIMYDLDDGWGEERAGLGFTTAQPRVGNTNDTTRVANTQTNKNTNTQTRKHKHTITQIQTQKAQHWVRNTNGTTLIWKLRYANTHILKNSSP